MGEVAEVISQTNAVETKALTIVDQAKAVKVTDAETYTTAASLWKAIGEMIKEVKDTFDPICEAAHRAHKAATEKRAKYLDPLTTAQKDVKRLMSNYDAEQETKRLAEQRRLEELARKAEEERKLQEAIAAEAELKAAGFKQEEIAQEIEAIIEEPITAAPIQVPKSTPKLAGGPVYSERWFASVVDIKSLCRAVADGWASPECVMGLERDKATGIISCPTLNRMATALKSTMNIPGVQAKSKRV